GFMYFPAIKMKSMLPKSFASSSRQENSHRFINFCHTFCCMLALPDGRAGSKQYSCAAQTLLTLAMRYLATILITLLLAVPAMSVELFRYRGAAKDGGTLEYLFEAGEQNSSNAITKEKAAEIAADFMTTFYHIQVGALETQEFRTTPVPFWLISFSDTIKGL